MSLLILLALAAAYSDGRPVMLAQARVEQASIIRIRPVPVAPPPMPRIRWDEKKGPKCIQISSLAGALVSSPDSIDLFIRGGQRFRAKLEKGCPSIEFYSGFYMRQSRDGRVCEDRDRIHSRSGGECKIEKFRTLVPAR